jgi:hypothetical protein
MDNGVMGSLVATVDDGEPQARKKLRQPCLQALSRPTQCGFDGYRKVRVVYSCQPTMHDAVPCTPVMIAVQHKAEALMMNAEQLAQAGTKLVTLMNC